VSKYQLIANGSALNSMVIHPQLAKELRMTSSFSQKTLHFGVSSHKVNVQVSRRVQNGKIVLSRNILQHLRIPTHSYYELRIKEDGIHLGPYVGFLLSHYSHNLADYLPYLADYVSFYDQIGGTIIAFGLDGVRKDTRKIHGFVYNPITQKWEEGLYAYPSSMFIKTAMIPSRDLHYFQAQMGVAVFNNFNFDKWEMHRLLSQTEIVEYLPKTKLYRQAGDIESFLKRKERIYLKPLNGSRGRSVARINKNKKGIWMRYRDKGKNHELVFSKFDQFKKFLKKSVRPKAFIIQKAVDLLSYQGSIIDFRMLMVKDDQGQWKDVGLVSRYGPLESVVSNISAGGLAEEGEKTLQRVLNLSDDERMEWRQQLRTIAYRVAKILDDSGVKCGNMGVDFAIDSKGRIWILEIQHNNPDPTLALDADDPQVYHTILLHHLLYLKGLAGFEGGPVYE